MTRHSLPRLPRPESKPEATLAFHIAAVELGAGMVRELAFDPARRWRFDFAWPGPKIAVEVEGLLGGAGGRHQRKAGMTNDCEKYNAAVLAGWRLLRFPPSMIYSGVAVSQIQQILGPPPWAIDYESALHEIVERLVGDDGVSLVRGDELLDVVDEVLATQPQQGNS